jgi:hypothetical protein
MSTTTMMRNWGTPILVNIVRSFQSCRISLMPPPRKISLGLRDEYADVGGHIAYFWESGPEFDEGVRFLEVGLDDDDFCVIFAR